MCGEQGERQYTLGSASLPQPLPTSPAKHGLFMTRGIKDRKTPLATEQTTITTATSSASDHHLTASWKWSWSQERMAGARFTSSSKFITSTSCHNMAAICVDGEGWGECEVDNEARHWAGRQVANKATPVNPMHTPVKQQKTATATAATAHTSRWTHLHALGGSIQGLHLGVVVRGGAGGRHPVTTHTTVKQVKHNGVRTCKGKAPMRIEC